MSQIWSWSLLVIAFVFISKSADLIIRSTTTLAKKFGISEFNMGFFVLGLATTTPELFIGINSALANQPQLALGNLIGATIVLLTLIIGLNALVTGKVRFINTFSSRDMWLTSFIISLPALLLLDGNLTRFDGLLLLAFYVLFYLLLNKEQSFTEHLKRTFTNHHEHLFKSLFLLGLGVGGLLIFSRVIVSLALSLAKHMSIPFVLVGLLMLSIGTNIPELTVLFSTLKNKHKSIGIGDFLGSAVANTPVLGIIALFAPITLTAPVRVYISLGVLVIALITFNAYFYNDKKITRLEGLSLIGLYVFYILFLLYFATFSSEKCC